MEKKNEILFHSIRFLSKKKLVNLKKTTDQNSDYLWCCSSIVVLVISYVSKWLILSMGKDTYIQCKLGWHSNRVDVVSFDQIAYECECTIAVFVCQGITAASKDLKRLQCLHVSLWADNI